MRARIRFLPLLVLVVVTTCAADARTCFGSECLEFKLAERWFLAERQVDGDALKVDHYKIKPLNSPSAGKVIPSISLIFHGSNEPIDPIQYQMFMRSKIPMSDVDKPILLQPLNKEQNTYRFLGFQGRFENEKVKFVQYLVTGTEGSTGFSVVITCPQDVFPQIEKDVGAFLSSLRHNKKAPGTTFKNPADRQKTAEDLFQKAFKMVTDRKSQRIDEGLQLFLESCDLGHSGACAQYSVLKGIKEGL